MRVQGARVFFSFESSRSLVPNLRSSALKGKAFNRKDREEEPQSARRRTVVRSNRRARSRLPFWLFSTGGMFRCHSVPKWERGSLEFWAKGDADVEDFWAWAGR
jgi:hypothetical protein